MSMTLWHKQPSGMAIATSGGGMSCAYSAGALLALAEVHGITEPDLVIGSSGSTGSLAYYVAKQYAVGRKIWTELLATQAFIHSSGMSIPVMNLEYLIDDVFKKQEPLHVDAIKTARTRLIVAATDYETGQAVYFDNWNDVDIFEALRASKAAPVVYHGEVWINGRRYLDGDLASSLPKNIEKARAEGARKILAIDNSNATSAISGMLLRRYAKSVPTKLCATIEAFIKNKPMEAHEESGLLYIRPSVTLPVTMLDIDKPNLERTMQIGYDDIARHPRLPAFLRE